jgi:hypothetical protein
MSFLADLAFPGFLVWGKAAATAIQDAEVADAYYSGRTGQGSMLGHPGTDFNWAGWAGRGVADEFAR